MKQVKMKNGLLIPYITYKVKRAYLSIIIDLYDRKIVVFEISNKNN